MQFKKIASCRSSSRHYLVKATTCLDCINECFRTWVTVFIVFFRLDIFLYDEENLLSVASDACYVMCF